MPTDKLTVAATPVAKKLATIDAVKPVMEATLGVLARAVTNALANPDRLAGALKQLGNWSDALEAMQASVKQAIRVLVAQRGDRVEGTASLALRLPGATLRIKPHRTGYDSKKVEALLRSHGIDPSVGMDADVKWKANADKLAMLQGQGRFTEDHLASCKYDLSWDVMSPEANDE